jgi:hypothetical protein
VLNPVNFLQLFITEQFLNQSIPRAKGLKLIDNLNEYIRAYLLNLLISASKPMDHLLDDGLTFLKLCAFGSVEEYDALLEDIANGSVVEESCELLQVVGDDAGHLGLAAVVEIGHNLLEVAHQDLVLGRSGLEEVDQLLPERVRLLG